MHSTEQIQIRQESYNTKDARLADTGVKKTLCLLLPSSALVAGMSTGGECISARYSNGGDCPEWENALFDHVLGNELMLRQRHAEKYVFTGAGRQLLIPDPVHQQEHSRHLLRDIYHLLPDDHLGQSACKADKAHLVFAYDHAVQEIAERYIQPDTIHALNLYQFLKTEKQSGYYVNCLLTERGCYLTLRENGRLLWHHTVSYSRAEDIVFHILHACREWDIPAEKLHLECTATFPGAIAVINRMRDFFADVYAGVSTDGDWAPVVYLLQQLDSCVS